jgi:hypothetical protein
MPTRSQQRKYENQGPFFPAPPEPPVGGDDVDYSLAEQATGQKWVDGRTIYQKTIKWSRAACVPVHGSSGASGMPHGITGLDMLVDLSMIENQTMAIWNNGTSLNDMSWVGWLGGRSSTWNAATVSQFVLGADATHVIFNLLAAGFPAILDTPPGSPGTGTYKPAEFYVTLRYVKAS